MSTTAKKILAIDDDAAILGVMRRSLEGAGYAVETASSGREGLAKFSSANPDLVLTDLRMPDMDGLDVLCQLGETSPDTPVIVVSGQGSVADVVKVLRLGAWDYLVKPFADLAEVGRAAERCLDRAQLRRESRAYQAHIEELVKERTRDLDRELAERARVEDALRAERLRYEQVVELVADVVWTYETDPKGGYAEGYIAPSVDRLLHLPKGTVGNDFARFFRHVHPEDVERVKSAMAEALRDRPALAEVDYRVKTGRGEERWFRSRGTVHPRPNGNAVLYGITSDVTEQRRAEESLRASEAMAVELAKEAQEASEAKSRFMANVSHELRTPMNGVIGFAQLLACTPLDNEQKFLLDTLAKSGHALLRVINDILDFSRIEAGRLKIAETDFDLRALVEDFASSISLQAFEKKLQFGCTIAPEVPLALRGDPERIRQVMANLVGNAIKFTDRGEVAVAVGLGDASALKSGDAEGEGAVCGRENEVVLEFSVRDTGVGIPGDKLDAIFERFEQVDGSYTRRFGGTGLGLTISKALARLMGGDIFVESELDRGSTFRFVVPLGAREEMVGGRRKAVAGDVRMRKSRGSALVVEDNSVNQLAAELMLKELGIPSDAASNGAEALAAMGKTAYDIVFMDVQMPVMDGVEATRQIRAGGWAAGKAATKPTVPVIAMTAYAMQGDRERFLAEGMDDYLAKPVSLADLTAVLDRWLPDGGAEGNGAKGADTKKTEKGFE